MTPPSDPPRVVVRPAPSRRRRWVIAVIAVLIVLVASTKTFAVFYTDALWFSSVHLHAEWLRLFEVKAGLMAVFTVAFAALLLASLLVAERLAPKGPTLDAEDEFVRRYREVMGPYSAWLRAVVVVVVSLIVGSQTIGQWQNWLLFTNRTDFGATDPVFHRDVSYFVMTLPFEQFLVHWALVALVVVLVITVLSHYLNGGIRVQGQRPRVRPAVKAHLSVILGLIALVKAVGYYLARFSLTLSTNGIVKGMTYTDAHARLPALELLILVSLAAAGLLIYNIRRRGWALPILGVGLWFLIALSAGTIYPAVVQALKVTPAQNTLEAPYIQRNIDATRAAYGLTKVSTISYPASNTLTATQLTLNADTTSNVRLWDPTETGLTYDRLQDLKTYYQFNTLAVDRYRIDNVETPVIVGVREINSQNLPSTSWVNTTLQFTHGYGMIVSPASQSSNGNPVFAVGNVPPQSQAGYPTVTQPSVYFGLDDSGYVVADTKQPEINFQLGNGSNDETHYTGSGGVPIGSFLNRFLFAVRFWDKNLLISNQITGNSRIMFDRGLQARVTKAAPFLVLDSDPYPALVDGQIDWIQDAYTTTDNYPYAQDAVTTAVNGGSGLLNQNFNYVRNSVKVVENAYTGAMTFYVTDPSDPIIRSYEKAFPGMFTPMSSMSSQLRDHLRYPEDIFAVQATMYGKYHVTSAPTFYGGADAWVLSPSPGAGSPSQALATTFTTNAQGQAVSTGQPVPMSPIYQELEVPGENHQSFSLLDAFVPYSSQGQIQNLSGFMIAGSDPGDYGTLKMFVTPRNNPAQGPSIVASQIDSTQQVSQQVSLLNQEGSSVLLGNVLMIPIADSILYVQPLYVTSSRNSIPNLRDVIAVYGDNPAVIEPTLQQALSKLFGGPVSTTPESGSSSTVSPAIAALLYQALSADAQAQVDLKAGNLGAYQSDILTQQTDLAEAEQLSGGKLPAGITTSTTTTTTTPTG